MNCQQGNNMQLNNIEQRLTQHCMRRFSDSEEVSKVIFMFHDRKSPAVDGLHPEFIKGGGRWLVEVLYTVIKNACQNLAYAFL